MKTVKDIFEEIKANVIIDEAKYKNYISNIRVKGMARKKDDSDDSEDHHTSEIKRIKTAMEKYPSNDAQVISRQKDEIKKHQEAVKRILNLSNK